MKIAVVVQRYGAEINGGAELHARYIAEHLAPHVQVEVLTTCATDYITWRNSLPAGVDNLKGVTVRRFPVVRERDPEDFGRWSDLVFRQPHAIRDELAWLDSEGPTSPELIAYIKEHERTFDYFIFFSFRYYHSYHGARAVPHKAILVPTAERDGALGLQMFQPVFRGVRALMYNSYEERALINAVARNEDAPGVIVGIGSEIPEQTSPARFRQKFDFRERFAIYVGRIDENKGCGELFSYFQRYSRMLAEGMHLVLIGNPIIPIPDHPKIHHLGFVSDQDKFDALAASELLIMPSYLESLSMVALEAWALGKPVLANGRCDVLKGQCIRSNGGLYYESFEEFIETLRAIDLTPSLAAALGRNGRDYFRAHYAWPVIERKYLDMLQQLSKEGSRSRMEAAPGWFARRRRSAPPANEILATLPTGAALERSGASGASGASSASGAASTAGASRASRASSASGAASAAGASSASRASSASSASGATSAAGAAGAASAADASERGGPPAITVPQRRYQDDRRGGPRDQQRGRRPDDRGQRGPRPDRRARPQGPPDQRDPRPAGGGGDRPERDAQAGARRRRRRPGGRPPRRSNDR